jgi:hypothetical protein
MNGGVTRAFGNNRATESARMDSNRMPMKSAIGRQTRCLMRKNITKATNAAAFNKNNIPHHKG